MKISAVIAEFNPFHAGHKILTDSMHAQSDAVVAIMSGNFVQRGECALYEKGERAAAAIKNGVDLVIELPAVYALSSAEGFAKGAVQTLHSCGVIDTLHFGSECADLSKLSACADILNNESDVFSAALTEKLSEGFSFPAARQAALGLVSPDAVVLDMPNNTLAVEYIRELKRLNSPITPVTLKRSGAGYNDTHTEEKIPSASVIRALLKSGESADEYMLYPYKSMPVFMNQFDIPVAARLKAISPAELCALPDCNEEIVSRLKSASVYNSFDEIVSSAACRRYTQSRIRRILCNMLVGNTFKTLPSPTYIRPLAFNKTGGEILRKMKSTASLPIAARGATLKNDAVFNLECRCSDIYNLIQGKRGGMEYDYAVQIF